MRDLIEIANEFVKQYAYLLTLVSFIVGVAGMVIGVVTRIKLKELIRLKERVISSHLQNMRRFRRGGIVKSSDESVKHQFVEVYNGLLEMISIFINPSETELEYWLKSGRIDKDDYEELFKLKWR